MDIRKNICIAKNVKYTTQFQLEDLFLTRSESEFLAKKSDYCDLV
jgi:phage gpG-like protein